MNKSKANEFEFKLISKLETNKKLILILDLDNTLLHTCENQIDLTE